MSKLPRTLYRGFARAAYEKTAGGLRPRAPGVPFEHCFKAGEILRPSTGEVLKAGVGAVAGLSDTNAALRHQADPGDRNWRDSGISTSPYRDRAVYYATAGNCGQPGCFLVVDTKLLSWHAVTAYRVAEIATTPSIPDDDEYILVAADFCDLPEAIVVDRFDV